jgi:glycosyltransferase involved in cell wall biosynthesis
MMLQGLADFTAKRADIVVADSTANYQQVMRKLRLNPGKCALVHPGVDTSIFKFVQSEIKKTLRIPPDAPMVLFVGPLEPRKGVEVLLRAVPKITRIVPNVKLVMVGRDTNFGPEGKSIYQHFVHEANLRAFADKLVHLDSVPDEVLVQLYSACDVLVLPSLHESFGFPVVEAMACGKPVVASETGIVPEIGLDGRCGSAVPIGDSDALSSEIVRFLLLTPEDKAAIAETNSKKVQREFSVQAWVEKMEALYRHVLTLADIGQSATSRFAQ